MNKYKNMKIPVAIIFYGTEKQLDEDVYFRQSYNRFCNDINSVMGIIDGRLKSMIDKEEGKKYIPEYLESILINILMRNGLFTQGKEKYMEHMLHIYDEYLFNEKLLDGVNVVDQENNENHKNKKIKNIVRCVETNSHDICGDCDKCCLNGCEPYSIEFAVCAMLQNINWRFEAMKTDA